MLCSYCRRRHSSNIRRFLEFTKRGVFYARTYPTRRWRRQLWRPARRRPQRGCPGWSRRLWRSPGRRLRRSPGRWLWRSPGRWLWRSPRAQRVRWPPRRLWRPAASPARWRLVPSPADGPPAAPASVSRRRLPGMPFAHPVRDHTHRVFGNAHPLTMDGGVRNS